MDVILYLYVVNQIIFLLFKDSLYPEKWPFFDHFFDKYFVLVNCFDQLINWINKLNSYFEGLKIKFYVFVKKLFVKL